MKDGVFLKNRNLYLVTGEECSRGRTTLEVVQAAISGGVDIVQMREKTAAGSELRELGEELSVICRDNGVIFIVNDDPYLARAVGAHGVHLGQEDIKKYPVELARDILGTGGIIGLSTHSAEEAKAGSESGADYIAFGPVFPTKTKDYFIGTAGIPEVMGFSDIPVVVIGGINGKNIEEVLSLGARNVAMIRHITEANDIKAETMNIRQRILSAGGIKGPIRVRINGVSKELEREMSIFEAVEEKGLVPGRVAVEHNGRIVPDELWREVYLAAGDDVEMVSFVGGG
jgi:thiamine-phosphate pyrophosphorylase